jgi:hypothetical protein
MSFLPFIRRLSTIIRRSGSFQVAQDRKNNPIFLVIAQKTSTFIRLITNYLRGMIAFSQFSEKNPLSVLRSLLLNNWFSSPHPWNEKLKNF